MSHEPVSSSRAEALVLGEACLLAGVFVVHSMFWELTLVAAAVALARNLVVPVS